MYLSHKLTLCISALAILSVLGSAAIFLVLHLSGHPPSWALYLPVVVTLALVGVAASVLIIRLVLMRPLSRIFQESEQAERGGLISKFTPISPSGEVEDLAASIRRLIEGTRRSRQHLKGFSRALWDRMDDVTHDLRRSLDELEAKHQELARVHFELEMEQEKVLEASRLKSEFVANISHELRTPLSAIIGFTQVLLDGQHGPLNDRQREFLEVILERSRHQLEAINDLIELARIQAGKVEFHPQKFDLRGALEGARSLVCRQVERKGIAMEMSVEPNEATIYTDPGRFKQILSHLLVNAVKFTDPGGKVSIGARVSNGSVTVEVSDTGVGIPRESLLNIFDEFRQLDGSRSRTEGGLGLGLVIVKRLVELQGGQIKVDSQEGKGTTFSFSLP